MTWYWKSDLLNIHINFIYLCLFVYNQILAPPPHVLPSPINNIIYSRSFNFFFEFFLFLFPYFISSMKLIHFLNFFSNSVFILSRSSTISLLFFLLPIFYLIHYLCNTSWSARRCRYIVKNILEKNIELWKRKKIDFF